MPELTGDDVTAFTGERLDGDSDEAKRMLKAALEIARRDAGWHVNPVRTDTLQLDGPDSRILWLPTRKLVDLISVEEDGVAITPIATKLSYSRGQAPGLSTPVRVRKESGAYWTCRYGGIEVEMEHGYDDVEAADWRQAVLSMVDQIALVSGGGTSGVLTRKRVDDVDYSYQSYLSLGQEAMYSMDHILADFRLPSTVGV